MRKFKVASAFAVATVVGLLANMSPAVAEGAGVSIGHSDINFNMQPAIPPCAKTTGTPSITLTNVGTVGVVNPANGLAAEYAGAFSTKFSLAGHSFSPVGTYSGSSCSGAPGQVAVTGWTGTAQISPVSSLACSGTGSYIRVTNAYEITATGTCKVTTAGTLDATGPVTFVFTGNQNPCLGDFGVPNCEGALNDTEFEGVYTQVPR
jgi:hypothetical protein